MKCAQVKSRLSTLVLVFLFTAWFSTTALKAEPDAAPIAPSLTSSEGKNQQATDDFDKMAVLQLLEEQESVKRNLREYEAKILDLENYERRIEMAKLDVHRTIDEAREKIETALKDLQSGIGTSETPLNLDIVNEKLSGLKQAVFLPYTWRRLRQIPRSETNFVDASGLLDLFTDTEEQEAKNKSLLASLEKVLTDSGAEESTRKQINALDVDKLNKEYKGYVEHVEKLMSALKEKVTSHREHFEQAAREGRSRMVRMHEAIARKAGGQEETFRIVGWMMILLFALFFLSIVARLSTAFLKLDHERIIDEKTLIEFGGMAFILLAIIILGNTEKLDRQALGTLLGTIAGYIFGKGFVVAPRTRAD